MRIRSLADRRFFKEALSIALPLTLQFLVTSSVGLVDVLMVGRLGEVPIAAAGIANQVVFLLTIMSFGIYSGTGAFLSQFWGAQDLRNIQRTIGMMYTLGIGVAVVFMALSYGVPRPVLTAFSRDPQVLDQGVTYLKIVAVSFIPYTVSLALSIACRCTGNIRLPMVASFVSVGFNIVGNAVLIFGLLGFPAMGLSGAAIATVGARIVECAILLVGVYKGNLPAAANLRELFAFDRAFVRRYMKITAPVWINETIWSLGASTYLVIYGMLGTEVLAAVQISNAVMQFLSVLIRGSSDASGIVIGRKIGAGDEREAIDDSLRFLVFMPVLGIAICVTLLALMGPILSLYRVSDATLAAARVLLTVQAFSCIPRAVNSPIIVGICRCGGDTTFACFLDILPLWLLGVPLGFLGVYLGLPLWGVALCILSEEFVKPFFGVPRILSKKWLHNVVSDLKAS